MAGNFGERQSPIDIDLRNVKFDDSLHGIHYEHHPTDCAEVTNKGSTWSIRLKSDPQTRMRGAHLPGTYRLAEAHAHWGEKSNDGSEHLFGNKAFASELHMVHYNEKFGTIDEAKNHPDGLAVLGILFEEVSHDNQYLEPLIHALQQVQYKGQVAQFPNGFDLTRVLPNNREFCTYHGSLTTPPYTECVIWTVFVHPIPISSRQLEVFRTLEANEQSEQREQKVNIVNNYRAPQHLAHREMIRLTLEESDLRTLRERRPLTTVTYRSSEFYFEETNVVERRTLSRPLTTTASDNTDQNTHARSLPFTLHSRT